MKKNIIQDLGFLPKFIYEDKSGKPFGLDGRIRVNYFLDLLSAVHIEQNLVKLSNILAYYLINQHIGKYDGIVGPKNGNTILVREVSKKLKLKSGFVRRNMLFSRLVEGVIYPGDKVILVDDVGSDGEILQDTVINLRKAGIYVDKAVVVVNRKEGDVLERLKDLGISYRYWLELDDDDLRKILYG